MYSQASDCQLRGFLHTFSYLNVKLNVDQHQKVAILQLAGAATSIRLPTLAEKLECARDDVELRVDLQHLHDIDHPCLDLLISWAK